jgi:hypothetical protein
MRGQIPNVRFLAMVVGLGVLRGGGGDLVDGLPPTRRTARGLLREVDLDEAKGEYGRAEQAPGRCLAIRPRGLVALARNGLVPDRQDTNPRARLQALLALELESTTRHKARERRDVRWINAAQLTISITFVVACAAPTDATIWHVFLALGRVVD